MPNVFSFSGSSGESVLSTLNLPLYQKLPVSLYFSCWVCISPEYANDFVCLGSIAAANFQDEVEGVYDLILKDNNYLGVYCGGTQIAMAGYNGAIADGQWHYVGFHVFSGMTPTVWIIQDGTLLTTEIVGDAPPAKVAGIEQGIRPTQTYVSLGCPSACGAGVLNGMVGNVLLQQGVLNQTGYWNEAGTADLSTFMMQSMIGIPKVDGNTLSMIALLPQELTSGQKAYIDLATGTALTISSPSTVTYVTNTYLDGLTEMATYAPTTPFPGTDSGTDGLSEAMVYILHNCTTFSTYLKPISLANLRAQYTLMTFPYNDAYNDVSNMPPPTEGVNFTLEDFGNAVSQLQEEMLAVPVALNYFTYASQYLGTLQLANVSDIGLVMDNLDSNEQSASSNNNIGDIISIVSLLMSLAGPQGKMLGAGIKGAFTVINLLSSPDPQTNVTYPLGVLQGEFTSLSAAANTAWEGAISALVKSTTTIVGNWGALSLVNQYSGNGQFGWQVAYSETPQGFDTNSQIYLVKNLLVPMYEVTNIIGESSAVEAIWQTAPAPFRFSYPSGNQTAYWVLASASGTAPNITLSNWPSQQVGEYVFGSTLNVSQPEFWFQWGWNVVDCFDEGYGAQG